MASHREIGRVGIVALFGRTHAHAQYVPNKKTLPTLPTLPLLTRSLLEAAMRICDLHGDDERARAEMREDCLALNETLQADLLAHFRSQL